MRMSASESDPQAQSLYSAIVCGKPDTQQTLGKGTISKMGFVPLKQGLMIKSREDASLQRDLRAGTMGNGSSEKRKSTVLKVKESSGESFRRQNSSWSLKGVCKSCG